MATFSAHRAVAGAQKLAFAALASALASAAIVSARLDFNLTQSLACTPLNISFVPENDGYPYTVWIGGVLQAGG